MESAATVIPFPAPISRVTAPGPVDDMDKPDPAVIDVIT